MRTEEQRAKSRTYMRNYKRIARMFDIDGYMPKLQEEAVRRNMTPAQLRHYILATVCNDNLFKALLDD